MPSLVARRSAGSVGSVGSVGSLPFSTHLSLAGESQIISPSYRPFHRGSRVGGGSTARGGGGDDIDFARLLEGTGASGVFARSGTASPPLGSDQFGGRGSRRGTARSGVTPDPSDAVPICASTLDKIRQLAEEGPYSLHDTRNYEKRRQLHEISKARASSWSNTLEGTRRKKIQARKDKLAAEERALQEVDRQEEEHRFRERQKILEKAGTSMRRDNERYKKLISDVMLTETLKEREEQKKVKATLDALERGRETKLEAMDLGQANAMLERECREKEEARKRMEETQVCRKHQLDEFKQKRLQEMQDDMLEGTLLLNKAQEDLLAEKKKAEKRKTNQLHALHETIKANEYLQQLRNREAEAERREDQRTLEFEKEIQQRKDMIKAKTEAVFNAKLAERQQMIEAQAKKLLEIKNTEDARVAGEVAEAQAREERVLEEKLAAQKKQREMIDRTSALQMEVRQAKRAEMMEEDRLEVENLQMELANSLAEEEADRQRRRKQEKQLASFQKQQAKYNQYKRDLEKQQRDAAAKWTADRKTLEDEEFFNFAKATITDTTDDPSRRILTTSLARTAKATLRS